jgi:AcrR family transcriptional regulator
MPRKKVQRASVRPYHHGDLRRSLIVAGLQIVEREGMEAVSLRAVARRARVSHSAPYHHFANKAELLAAVAAAGFDALVVAIETAVAQTGSGDPLDHLRAIGRAYAGFAVRRRSIFRLMFRPELTRPQDHPLLREAEARAFAALVTIISAGQQQGRLPGDDPLPAAVFCWSAVHGLAMLHVDQVLPETPLGAIAFEQLADHVIERCIRGSREDDGAPSEPL